MSVSEIISICVSAFATAVIGLIANSFKSYVREMRRERNALEKQEKAKDQLLLGMARVQLLEIYRKCEAQGYYSLEDREVYGKLFDAYRANNGNGVIEQLIPKLRALPTEPPKHKGDE